MTCGQGVAKREPEPTLIGAAISPAIGMVGAVPAGQRDRLERVCRYTLRPPVTDERFRLGADGQVVLQLRHPWADGTTSLVFEPTAFLRRLAVLVPRPRVNLVLYHGVLARGPRGAARWCAARHQSSPRTPAPLRHWWTPQRRPTTGRARDGPIWPFWCISVVIGQEGDSGGNEGSPAERR